MRNTRFSSPRAIHRRYPVGNKPIIITQRNAIPRSAREKKPLPLDPFSPAAEFQEPEYLDQQKKQLLNEISRLKPEIQQLTNEFNQIQGQIQTSGQYPTSSLSPKTENDNHFNPQNYLSSQLAELHAEHDRLSDELAKCRRLYSEQTEIRLNSDIEYQRKLLADLNFEYYQLHEQYESDQKQMDELIKSDIASIIKEQKKQINSLKKELQQLSNNEQQMIDDYMAIVNNVPQIMQSENILTQKKRQLQQAEHNKMRMSVELRKIKKEYEDRCAFLESEIAQKENAIKQKSGRDNWRKTCSVRSKDSTLLYPYDIETPESTPTKMPNTPPSSQSNSKRVTFNIDKTDGMGIPRELLEQFYQYQQDYYGDENEDEDGKLDEDELLDLGDFHVQSKRVNTGDTFFADTIEQISKSLLVPPEKEK